MQDEITKLRNELSHTKMVLEQANDRADHLFKENMKLEDHINEHDHLWECGEDDPSDSCPACKVLGFLEGGAL